VLGPGDGAGGPGRVAPHLTPPPDRARRAGQTGQR
jgi:hypothetical protein